MTTPTPFVADPVLTAIAVNYRNPDVRAPNSCDSDKGGFF